MPIQYKSYGCKFKCGLKHNSDIKTVLDHEKICFGNPDRRACKTCKHLKHDYNTVYNPHHGGDPGSTDHEEKFYYCAIDDEIDLTEKLKADCHKWELM